MNKNIIFFAFVMLSCVLIGCNKSVGLTGLVSASGELRLNGEPVDNATILFYPVGQTRAASAVTDKNGNFNVMTLNPNDGIYPGDYIITVTKIEQHGEIIEDSRDEKKPPIDTREIIYFLPSKYSELDTTDLKITIPKNGNNNIALNLTGEINLTPKKVKELIRR
jgi:hypothetical protein